MAQFMVLIRGGYDVLTAPGRAGQPGGQASFVILLARSLRRSDRHHLVSLAPFVSVWVRWRSA